MRPMGKRVGLITNHSAIDRAGVSAIDRIATQPRLELVALLAPEHGIRGTAAEGCASATDGAMTRPLARAAAKIRRSIAPAGGRSTKCSGLTPCQRQVGAQTQHRDPRDPRQQSGACRTRRA